MGTDRSIPAIADEHAARFEIDEGPSSRAGASAVTSDLFLLLIVLLREDATVWTEDPLVASTRIEEYIRPNYGLCSNLQKQGSFFNSIPVQSSRASI